MPPKKAAPPPRYPAAACINSIDPYHSFADVAGQVKLVASAESDLHAQIWETKPLYAATDPEDVTELFELFMAAKAAAVAWPDPKLGPPVCSVQLRDVARKKNSVAVELRAAEVIKLPRPIREKIETKFPGLSRAAKAVKGC
ncbi:MAG TPA: hypothetical protein VHB73_03000 [Alphaproteobacteria bacterium]|nr:hypothetical protein [Alphaproteobacteria bacterium]